MKYIKCSNDFGNVYILANNIEAIVPRNIPVQYGGPPNRRCTTIYMGGHSDNFYDVKESPEDIIAKLAQTNQVSVYD